MASAVKVKSGFALAELDLNRRLKDEMSYQQKLRKLQIANYLWRFWQRLPLPGNITIFDRTWYGRVLVERVEALTRPKEWRRAYDEINAFEKMLVDDGIRLAQTVLAHFR